MVRKGVWCPVIDGEDKNARIVLYDHVHTATGLIELAKKTAAHLGDIRMYDEVARELEWAKQHLAKVRELTAKAS